MLFIGSIINSVRGIKKTYKLQNEENRIDQSLEEFSKLDGYLDGLVGFERLIAKDELLMGEYTLKRQRLLREGTHAPVETLWRRVIEKMKSNLQEVAHELEKKPANMFHIAKILQGIKQLVGETETQVACLNNEIKILEKSLESLSSSVDNIEQKISFLQQAIEGQQEKLAATEKLFLRILISGGFVVFLWLVILSLFK